jgi:hypothetical protein
LLVSVFNPAEVSREHICTDPIQFNKSRKRSSIGKSYNTVLLLLLLLATGISFPAFCRASDGYSRIGV